MVGGAGSANAMRAIKAGNTVLKATVIYPPTQAADGIRLARLARPGQGHVRPGRGRGAAPRSVLDAPVVTKDNVDQYLPTALRVLTD